MSRRAVRALTAAVAMQATTAAASPHVWTVDDGSRPSDHAPSRPEPGPVRLFGLRGETVAFQVVIAADDLALHGVHVDLPSLASDAGVMLANAPGAVDPSRSFGRVIERFVEPLLPIHSRTRTSSGGETIGWAAPRARPSSPVPGERVPDPLVPVELAPAWAPFPLEVPPHETRAVWFDITLPEDAAGGTYRGTVTVAAAREPPVELPLVLELRAATLPYAVARTMLFYDPRELRTRVGEGAAETQLLALLHRYSVTPLLSVDTAADLSRLGSALDGAAFTPERGYDGPGRGVPDDVLAIGAYGALGEPTRDALARVAEVVHGLAHAPEERRDTFLYAIDERCASARAARWRRALAAEGDPRLAALRVGETCDARISSRSADVAMVSSPAYDDLEATAARDLGKWAWVYNGMRPRSGSLVLDAPLVDLRANGWIASAFDVSRWFYWEATFWNDDNRGGHGPVDPFEETETFHNASGDVALGDGLLVYPGTDLRFPAHSLGFCGVVPSMRLANLRRGIQDAGYVALVAARDPALAERIVHDLVPLALDEVSLRDAPPSWPQDAARFGAARRALFDAIDAGACASRQEALAALAEVAARRRARRPELRRWTEGTGSALAISLALSTAAVALLVRRLAAPAARRRARLRKKDDPTGAR